MFSSSFTTGYFELPLAQNGEVQQDVLCNFAIGLQFMQTSKAGDDHGKYIQVCL